MKKIGWSLLLVFIVGGLYLYANSRIDYQETNWEKTGYIVKNNPGMQQGVLYIVFEEAGSPALTAGLKIGEKTKCTQNETQIECSESNILGKKANVQGYNDNGIILVNDLTILNSQ